MSTPARLHKQQEKEVDIMLFNIDERIERFAMRYAPAILLICTILMMVLLIALCFALFGNGAVDSGVQYNHLGDII